MTVVNIVIVRDRRENVVEVDFDPDNPYVTINLDDMGSLDDIDNAEITTT